MNFLSAIGVHASFQKETKRFSFLSPNNQRESVQVSKRLPDVTGRIAMFSPNNTNNKIEHDKKKYYWKPITKQRAERVLSYE